MKILKIISTVSLIGIFGTASANSSNDTQLKAEPSIGIKSITLHLKNLQNSSQADFEIFGIKNGEHKLIDRESVAPMDDELVTFLEAKIGKYDKLLVKETNVSDQLYKLDQLNNNVELRKSWTESLLVIY